MKVIQENMINVNWQISQNELFHNSCMAHLKYKDMRDVQTYSQPALSKTAGGRYFRLRHFFIYFFELMTIPVVK